MIDSEIQQVEKYYNLIMEYLVTYSMQILGAILILFIGLWIAQKVSNMVAASCSVTISISPSPTLSVMSSKYC